MAQPLPFLKSLNRGFSEFFFRREVPYGLALTRMCLSAVMLCDMGVRSPRIAEFYSADGAAAPIALNYGFPDLLPLLPATWAVLLYCIMLFLLFTLMIGWKSRLSAAGVFVLFTYFTLQDSLSTLTKYSVISSHIFLLLSLSQCGAVWSVDRLRELQRQRLPRPLSWLAEGRAVEIWPQRLIQIFIAVVYFGAAITKLQTATYFSGDQMRFWLLSNVNQWNPLGEILSLQPALLVPMSYIAIIWEITFLFMVWNKGWRLAFLGLGVVFHCLTTITLGLYTFPLVCFSIYLSYVTPEDVAWWRARMGRKISLAGRLMHSLQLPALLVARAVPSLGKTGSLGFAAGLLGLAGLGLLSHNTFDLHAAHNTRRYELQPMPAERVRELFQNNSTIREEDKVFSFDIGKYMLAGRVVETTHHFSAGSRLYAQVNFVPPHGDMLVECQIASLQGLVYDQSDGVATREDFRYTFNYLLPESLDPGPYQLILKINNQEISRQTIEVTAH